MGCPARNPPRPATYEDLLEVPDHFIAEIIDGELIVSPRPAPPHALASSIVGADIVPPFHRKPGGPGGPGGWWILDEPELHLGGEVLVPDLAGWRRERMPALPKTAFFELAPDWACEVLSPGSVKIDRVDKMASYAREGVTHIWLVDPLARTVEIYRLEEGRWLRIAAHAGATTMRAEPFEAVELELSRWWMEEEEPATTPPSGQSP